MHSVENWQEENSTQNIDTHLRFFVDTHLRLEVPLQHGHLERTVFKPRDVADGYFQKRAACKIFDFLSRRRMASPRHGISELRSSSGLKTVSFRLQQSPWNSTLLAIPFRCVTPKHRTALRKTGTLPGEGVRSLKGFARQIIYSELKICRLNACLNAL